MQLKTIVLTESVHQDGQALLRARADFEVVVAEGMSRGDLAGTIARADAIGVRTFELEPKLLAGAASLAFVSKHGIGCDNIPVDYLSGRGIPVAITIDANAGTVAEHTLMLMLAVARNLLGYDRRTRAGEWDFRKSPMAGELAGRTLLVVGFGRIGRRVAALASAFDMKVAVFDSLISSDRIRDAGAVPAPDLDVALAEADFVALHVPLTPETAGLFDAARLRRMKRGAILVNCARGGIVEENELNAMLLDGHLAAAGIDVFEEEPPKADHPLFRLPNVVVTPHSAALTREGARKMAVAMAQNIIDFFDGRLEARTVINPHTLSRAASTG